MMQIHSDIEWKYCYTKTIEITNNLIGDQLVIQKTNESNKPLCKHCKQYLFSLES